MDNEGYEDEYALNPTDGWLDAHTGDDAEDCEDTHENNDAIIQLILQGFNERRSLNAWLLVLAVLDLSSEEICSVTHNSGASFGL